MLVYKILTASQWNEAEKSGLFVGAPIDLADGFIHLSSPETIRETAARHFAGQDDLMLAALEGDRLGELLKWEPSRGGALFPHLYRTFEVNEALWVKPLPLRNGTHDFSGLLP
ncbi:MAG: DUF952 domain-containing protein [Candidatus Riflebacteria bacterium]|nr:DUF952 domain-containing protein [Candidatus Riflebacteria bacterium]